MNSGRSKQYSSRHEAVSQCIVVAHEEGAGEKLLVAYFEAREGIAPEVSDLRGALEEGAAGLHGSIGFRPDGAAASDRKWKD